MKNIPIFHRWHVALSSFYIAAGCASFISTIAFAETITTSTTITIAGDTAQPVQVPSGSIVRYDIADDATLTFVRTGTYVGQSGGALLIGANASLIIGPADSTGRVIFENSSVTVHGGAIYMGSVNSYLEITNGIFRNNRNGNTPNSGVAGAIMNTQATGLIKLADVVFDGNHSYGNTGVMRVTGTLQMTGGGFYDNWAAGDHTGALHMNGATALVLLDNLTFDGNHARSTGGAMTPSSGTAILTNVVFTNNWAGVQGGAVRTNHGATGKLVFAMTEAGGTNSYLYSGNFASGQGAGFLLDADPQVINNAPAFAPHARGGGFYQAAGAGIGEFNIDGGVTLTIGTPDAVDRNYDTIASSTNNAKIAKTGGGDLVLNADNSYFSGTTYVQSGRLLLGNDEARYGGDIYVDAGAAFGGSGTVTTHFYDDAIAPTAVTAAAGSILQVGVSDRATEGLTIDGALTLADATVSYVAFGGTHAAQLDVLGALSVSGANIINLQSFVSGTYNLGSVAATLYNTYGASLSVNGGLIVAGGRHGATAGGTPADLQVVINVDKARAMKWTGAAGSDWNSQDSNWESQLDSTITKFAAGDLVEFDTNSLGNTTVVVDSSMPVVGIGILGSNTITFSGAGSIQASPYREGDEAEAAVMAGLGKLVKKGLGTIIFDNGNNEFKGGLDILDGGELVFARAGQLETGPSGIRFMQSATLTALGDGQLVSPLAIDPDKTAEIVTPEAVAFQINGAISGGNLKKAGAGTLVLASENTHGATILNSGTLRLLHGRALGNGDLEIASNDTTLEVTGGLGIDNAVNMGGKTLELVIMGGGSNATAFSGNFYGAGILSVSGTSPLLFSGSNNLSGFIISPNAMLTPAGSHALGGPNSSVVMHPGSVLNLGYAEVYAKNLEVDAGTLKINSFALGTPLLNISGTFALKNNTVIELGAKVPSGGYTLAKASVFDGVSGIDFTVAPGTNTQYGYDIGFDNAQGTLNILVIKPDVNPSKDIVSAFDGMGVIMGAVNSRITESFLSPLAEGRQEGRTHDYWVKGLGTFSSYKGDEMNVGFRDQTYGICTGYDREFFDWFLGGLYAGCAHGTIYTDYDVSHTASDTLFAGVYGSAVFGRIYAFADIMLGSLAADSKRLEGEASALGEYRTTVFGASGELGYKLLAWSNGGITPSVSLHYMDYRFRDHYESGPGAMFLDDFNTSILQGFASVTTNYGFTTPWGKAAMFDILCGYRFNFKDYASTLSGAFATDLTNSFHMQTRDYSDNSLVAGLAVRMVLTKRTTLAFTYDYETSKTHDRNTVSANVCWSW
jgi:autotransporter-associated beta strand protein/predicted outer membrane repeat protein